MLFDDGSTEITFFPTAYEWRVRDFAELQENQAGEVIAVSNGGQPPQRERGITLIRTDAERAALLTFLQDLDGATFEFTDDVGRIWDARWMGDFDTAETENADDGDGWHEVTLRLRLEGVASDAGLEAYGNADVSQMSIQKSGAAVLYFPLAYAPPLGRRDVSTAWKGEHAAFVAVDADRFTARRNLTARFGGLSRAFMRALEDYLVDTLVGAAHPFSLVHFRDGTRTFRWVGGLGFSQDDGGSYGGTIELMEQP